MAEQRELFYKIFSSRQIILETHSINCKINELWTEYAVCEDNNEWDKCREISQNISEYKENRDLLRSITKCEPSFTAAQWDFLLKNLSSFRPVEIELLKGFATPIMRQKIDETVTKI